MEYPQLPLIVAVIVVVGLVLGEMQSVQRGLRREDDRFRSLGRSVVSVVGIGLCYAALTLRHTFDAAWLSVLTFFLPFFVAPSLGWQLLRNAPSKWLRGAGVIGVVYPVVSFIHVIVGRS